MAAQGNIHFLFLSQSGKWDNITYLAGRQKDTRWASSEGLAGTVIIALDRHFVHAGNP